MSDFEIGEDKKGQDRWWSLRFHEEALDSGKTSGYGVAVECRLVAERGEVTGV